jgi:hypothetical protein
LDDAVSRLLTALPQDPLASRLDATLRTLATALVREDVPAANRALRSALVTLKQMETPTAVEQGRLPDLAAIALSLDYAESTIRTGSTAPTP